MCIRARALSMHRINDKLKLIELRRAKRSLHDRPSLRLTRVAHATGACWNALSLPQFPAGRILQCKESRACGAGCHRFLLPVACGLLVHPQSSIAESLCHESVPLSCHSFLPPDETNGYQTFGDLLAARHIFLERIPTLGFCLESKAEGTWGCFVSIEPFCTVLTSTHGPWMLLNSLVELFPGSWRRVSCCLAP